MAEINHWSEIGKLGQSTAASTLPLLTARLVFAALAKTEQLSAILAGFEDLLPSGVRGTWFQIQTARPLAREVLIALSRFDRRSRS